MSIMLKLCYKNSAKRTDEYYFDLQSQKVYKSVFQHIMQNQNCWRVKIGFAFMGNFNKNTGR